MDAIIVVIAIINSYFAEAFEETFAVLNVQMAVA